MRMAEGSGSYGTCRQARVSASGCPCLETWVLQHTNKAIVVVVEDDAAVRDSMRALLESAGYEVKDYASAKTFLKDPVPVGGCLVTDIRMPEMDGLELQEEITKRGMDIPVVIMTGH